MGERLKSTVEIALEKAKEIEGKERISLSEEQKRRIAEVRREYEAKVAEAEILITDREKLAKELQRLQRKREERLQAIYEEP